MMTKEHTATISLVKSASPFDGLDIQYVEDYNKTDLTMCLKFMLNDRHIGTIKNNKEGHYPFVFTTLSPLLNDFQSRTLLGLKNDIESKLEELFTYLNTLK